MKNFDTDREARAKKDRSFLIGGETFVMKASVRPEVLAQWSDVSESTPSDEILRVIDELVLDLIEQGQNGDVATRWKSLREREDDALSIDDLTGLVEWLIEEQTGQRPTRPPSSSSPGRGTTKRRSTAVSSSPAASTGSET